MASFEWPPSGGGSGGGVTSLNSLTGALTLTSSDSSITITPSGSTIDLVGASSLSLGIFGSTPNADGASYSAGTLTLQPADGTHPGGVSITSQTFAGAKTFSTAPILSSLTASTALVLDASKNIASLAYTNANTASTLVFRDGSNNFSAGTITASLTGHASLDVATSSLGIVTETTSSVLTLSGWSDATVGSPTITVKQASGSQSGYLSSTDWTTFNSKGSGTVTAVSIASANGFTGSSSGGSTPSLTLTGTLTGDITGTINSNSLTATTNSTLTTLSSLSLPLSQTTGVLPISKGGTDNGSLPVTAGGVLYTDGTMFQNVGAGTSGQALISQGSSAPVWSSGGTLGYASAYHALGNYWTTTSTSFVDPTSGGTTPALTLRSGSTITLTTAGSSLPGITFTPVSASAVYQVSATFTGSESTLGDVAYFQLIDSNGNVISSPGFISSSAGSIYGVITLTGVYSPGTTSPVTIKIQAAVNAGTAQIFNSGSIGNAIEWSIEQVPTNIISAVSYSLVGAMVTYGIYS